MARKKSNAQLEREIAEVLKSGERVDRETKRRRAHELFFLSEEQQGGKYTQHVEQFDNLKDAIDTLAKMPQGSITYGNADEGPQFMIVWAAPAHTDLLYWTDADLNAQPLVQDKTKAIRKRHGKGLDARFKRVVDDLKKRGYRWE